MRRSVKTIFLMISALLLFILMIISSNADENGNIMFTYDEESLALTLEGEGFMENYSSDKPSPWSQYAGSCKSVIVGSGIRSLGGQAFYRFTSLESISLPDGLVSIGTSCFFDCRKLTGITLPESTVAFGKFTFEASGIRQIVIPNGTSELPDGIFSSCTKLCIITVPSTLSAVGKYAFEDCISLKKIYYGASTALFGEIDIFKGNEPFESAELFSHFGNHDFSILSEIIEPSCNDFGYTVMECSCGETTDVDMTAPKGHKLKKYTVDEYTVTICERCGYSMAKRLPSGNESDTYTVTFTMGKTVISSEYRCGEMPSSPFDSGYFTLEDGALVRFEGWDKPLAPVVQDSEYTAEYSFVSGLYNDGCGTRLYDGNGKYLVGWQEYEGKKYYFFKATGYRVDSESYIIGGIPYDFNEDHSVKPLNGIKNVLGRYRCYENDELVTGWRTADGNRYYFYRSGDNYGYMAKQFAIIGGKLYYFYSATGILFDKSGTISGQWYDVDPENGNLLVKGLMKINDELYYFAPDNTIAKGVFVTSKGNLYYFDAVSGAALTDGIYEINGIQYRFDKNGVCLGEEEKQ